MRIWMLAVCAMATVTGAQARCDKSAVEQLQFFLPYASTNFAAINAGATTPGSGQYNLTPEAERGCPNHFILEDLSARDKYPEFWEVKFDFDETGSGEDIAISLIKTLSPVLKAAGYQDKPYINPGDDQDTYNMEWDGPSDTWVTVDTFVVVDEPGKIFYEIKVAHNMTMNVNPVPDETNALRRQEETPQQEKQEATPQQGKK